MTRRNHRPQRRTSGDRPESMGVGRLDEIAIVFRCAGCGGRQVGAVRRLYDEPGGAWEVTLPWRPEHYGITTPDESNPPAGYRVDCSRCGPRWIPWERIAAGLAAYRVQKRTQRVGLDSPPVDMDSQP